MCDFEKPIQKTGTTENIIGKRLIEKNIVWPVSNTYQILREIPYHCSKSLFPHPTTSQNDKRRAIGVLIALQKFS